MFKKITSDIDTPHVIVHSKNSVKTEKFKKFIDTYDDGSFKFKDLKYRPGALITCKFGIAEGFQYVNGEMRWGYVRSHTGVDRANAKSIKFDWGVVNDIIYSPFDFNRSLLMEYGNKSYGSLIMLFNDEYGFEMRIAHMNPKKDIIPWTLKQLRRNNSIKRNWVLGSAGNYGDSSGAHTHTEFKSIEKESEIFEFLLYEKFGDDVLTEYSKSEIIELYSSYRAFKSASSKEILRNWQEIKRKKQILFANRFLTRYIDWDKKPKTRYSSELLFNGL